MKLLGQLTNDRFDEATSSRQLLDDARWTRIGHVRPQWGLQIDPGRRQFRLEKGAHVTLVANDQARRFGKQPAAGCAGQHTHRQGAAIHPDGVHSGPQIDQEWLMKLLLNDPQIGGLLGKKCSSTQQNTVMIKSSSGMAVSP